MSRRTDERGVTTDGGAGRVPTGPRCRRPRATLFQAAAAQIDVPMVEVALHGDPDVLLDRARTRAESGGVHEIKARFSVNGPDYYDASPYQPVLPGEQVVRADTTDLDRVDLAAIAEQVSVNLRRSRS